VAATTVGAAVVATDGATDTDVDAGNVVDCAFVVATTGSVDDGDSVAVMLGSSTNGSLAAGRPAMATPARPPTTTTATANGQDVLIS
ncbi:MAG TPA: hypothetical protein VGC84_13325, partial [Ilumatobacteraceae bacterium]